MTKANKNMQSLLVKARDDMQAQVAKLPAGSEHRKTAETFVERLTQWANMWSRLREWGVQK
jgi:hypothetical protein